MFCDESVTEYCRLYMMMMMVTINGDFGDCYGSGGVDDDDFGDDYSSGDDDDGDDDDGGNRVW